MKSRKWMWIGLMSLGAIPNWAAAQIPGAVPGGIPAAGVPVGAVPAAQPATLWSWLGVSKPQLKACRIEKCATPCGQLLNKMTMPLSAMTGGIIPNFCPPLVPSPQELAESGAVGAAAKIKAEEANAKARKAAMRYLGTVDCTRWPEASDALIAGLRGDTNECVRYEAALALGNGCCCNKATMEALMISATCSDRDKKPREYSDRVRSAAAAALERCVACFVDPNPPKVVKPVEPPTPTEPPSKPESIPVPPEPGPGGDKGATAADKLKVVTSEEYYAKIKEVPAHLIIAEAKRVLEKFHEEGVNLTAQRRETSLVGIINESISDANVGTGLVMENGAPVSNAQIASARPQNLWDMVSRSADPVGTSHYGKTDVVVKSSVEPPGTFVNSGPLPSPTRIDGVPILPEPNVTRPAKPSDHSGYGEVTARPKTTAELAMQAKPKGNATVAPQPKPVMPNPLPAAVTAKDANKVTERESMKPIELPKPPEIAKPVDAVINPTPLAKRAITVLTEPHPAAVREEICANLTKADLESCPEMAPILVELARGNDPDSTRKAAIGALVRNQVNSAAVIAALEKLADDATPAIRVEAAIGLARLKVGK